MPGRKGRKPISFGPLTAARKSRIRKALVAKIKMSKLSRMLKKDLLETQLPYLFKQYSLTPDAEEIITTLIDRRLTFHKHGLGAK